MRKLRRLSALIPALALSMALTFGAGAQGIVNDVIDGAEEIVGDTADAAEDIIGGTDDTVGTGDNSIVDSTDEADIPDQIEDDADETVTNPEAGKDESDVGGNTSNEPDANPHTGIGIPFMTAGLVAVSTAGLAYLTRNKEGFKNGRE